MFNPLVEDLVSSHPSYTAQLMILLHLTHHQFQPP
jgi:hypothetical protein